MSFLPAFAARPAGHPQGFQQVMSPSARLDGESNGPDYARLDRRQGPAGELPAMVNGCGQQGSPLPPPGLPVPACSQAIYGSTASGDSRSVPASGDAVAPFAQGSVHETTGSVPVTSGSVPATNGSAPATAGSVPVMTGSWLKWFTTGFSAK